MTVPYPILFELNTRTWLRELSQTGDRSINLSEIPDSEIKKWARLGFTHIWFMGLWQIGPEARRIAIEHWKREWRARIPSTEQNIQGSPFAVQEYAVDSRLGHPLD